MFGMGTAGTGSCGCCSGDYELPRRYSFRYVKIDVLDISSKFNLVIEEACATALSSADESRLLPYSNSDKELVKIDRIACNTLHDCMQKGFRGRTKARQKALDGRSQVTGTCKL